MMGKDNTDSPLIQALRQFEAAEANLLKLERLWGELQALIPAGISFGDDPEYEDRYRAFGLVLAQLPQIDGWKPSNDLMELDEIAQSRLNADEIGEPEYFIHLESKIAAPGRGLREYRFRFNLKRRELIRNPLSELLELVDADIREIRKNLTEELDANEPISDLDTLRNHIDQIDTLLGSSVARPPRWGDLRRHLHFGHPSDFQDIGKTDWPNVKTELRKGLYGTNDPIPTLVEDLAELTTVKPHGQVPTRLDWNNLVPEEFERLLFSLISAEPRYENPELLMLTNAPDRGRDLSVTRVVNDSLGGTLRARVIIQCKHWLERSISVAEVASLREQMTLWEPPRVDVVIIATTGRFTADAVSLIEKQNQSNSALRIEMWPESHLERLLASRPALIAEFRLR